MEQETEPVFKVNAVVLSRKLAEKSVKPLIKAQKESGFPLIEENLELLFDGYYNDYYSTILESKIEESQNNKQKEMTLTEYKIEAMKTLQDENRETLKEYVKCKLITEYSELLDSVIKEKYHKKPNNNIEELGDILWYIIALEKVEYPDKRVIEGYKEDGWVSLIETEPASYRQDAIDFIIKVIQNISDFSFVKGTVTKDEIRETFYMFIKTVKLLAKVYENKDYNLSTIMQNNIDKLRKRHGEKYNSNHYQKENNNG